MSDLADRIAADIRGRAPFTPHEQEIDSLADGYRIQAEVTAALLGDVPGRRIAGYKIAFNRRSSMDYYRLSEPCYAPLFSDQIHESGVELPLADFADLVVEVEIAIRLKAGLAGGETPDAITRAIDAFLPALEILDPRGAFAHDPSAAAAVGQRVYNEGAVLGAGIGAFVRARVNSLSVQDIVARLTIDGEQVGEARGAAPQTPVEALVWLAGRLQQDGLPLEAGMIVLTGAHLPVQTVKQRGRIDATLEPLGSVSAILA